MANGPRLDLVVKAISAGLFGNIQVASPAARLIRLDPDFEGRNDVWVRRTLREFLLAGGLLDVRENRNRPEYQVVHPYWYRAVIPVELRAMPRGLFVELILVDPDETDPFVEIVSAHRQTT